MYNHYQGNTGRVRRIDDGNKQPGGAAGRTNSAMTAPELTHSLAGSDPEEGKGRTAPPRPVPAPPPVSRRPPSPLSGLSGELGRLLSRLSPMNLETEDLLLAMVLYLMYRESKDEELLFIMAAMFLM